MKRLHEEFDVLLPSVGRVEGDMMRDLLAEHGMPSMLHGPVFDRAELGQFAHDVLRRSTLLVPKGARAQAREWLVAAWGETDVARLESQ